MGGVVQLAVRGSTYARLVEKKIRASDHFQVQIQQDVTSLPDQKNHEVARHCSFYSRPVVTTLTNDIRIGNQCNLY